nr:dynein regulatory complex protein 8-like [Parasteatoda tepidariorum]
MKNTVVVDLSIHVKINEKSQYNIYTEQQIKEAFDVFNEDRKGRAKIKHLHTLTSALGRVLSTKDLKELELKVVDNENPEYMKLESILQPLTDILMKDMWKSASKENLLRAFRQIDKHKSGFLNADGLQPIFVQNSDESEYEDLIKFLEFATDPKSYTVNYKLLIQDLIAPQSIDVSESRRSIREKLVDDRYRLG